VDLRVTCRHPPDDRIGWEVSPDFDRRSSVPAQDGAIAQNGAIVNRSPHSLVIAVDGPSGSGKSSVSREVARRLGLAYLDTGAMYRAVCWSVLDAGIAPADADAVADQVRTLNLVMDTDPVAPQVAVNGRDVTVDIRQTRISEQVSVVAANQQVRSVLRTRQREIIDAEAAGPRHGCVAEGRDITTVVAPDADVRLLLTASERARLARRALEVHGTADDEALAATRDQVVRRDADDSLVTSFTTAADGVLQLDSSGLTFEQTVQAVLDAVTLQVGLVTLDVSDGCVSTVSGTTR
jgi:cytidylate kinase